MWFSYFHDGDDFPVMKNLFAAYQLKECANLNRYIDLQRKIIHPVSSRSTNPTVVQERHTVDATDQYFL
jgi:hypothetical protein